MKEFWESNVSTAFFIGALFMLGLMHLIYQLLENAKNNKHKMQQVTLMKALDMCLSEYVEVIDGREVVACGIVETGKQIPEQFNKFLLKPIKSIKTTNSEHLCTCLQIQLAETID